MGSQEHVVPCPACGSIRTEHLFDAPDRALRAVPGTFPYRECENCATVFQFPQPGEDVLAQSYAADYGNYVDERGLAERAAEPLARREAKRLMSHANTSGTLVDLGCGTGRFLERLQYCGWAGTLRGREYSPEVARYAGDRLGIEISSGTVEDAGLEPGAQSVIVLRHVIEHLREPVAELSRLREGLEPGGLLYLGTPDARALSAKVFGSKWWGYEVPRHLVVFSSDALTEALSRAGFDIVDAWWNWSPDMWSNSLRISLDPDSPWQAFAKPTNPLTLPLFGAAAALEVARHRSTMFSVVARRRD
ncbi:MAG: class I SAM-dependent methyltransferase [Solirubrobacteraceae bacterium]|nr:class I SAM-dependent methyltransferase [Patulibacter sp.]